MRTRRLGWSTLAKLLLGVAAVCAAWFGARSALVSGDARTAGATPLHTVQQARMGEARATVHRFRIDLARARLELVDLGFTTPLGDALGDAALIFNGGYWAWYGSKRAAEGLILDRDRILGHHDEKLGGGVLVVRAGRGRLELPSATLAASQPDFAVQCRPRLVHAGKLISGLDEQARAARTVLCLRDAGRTLDVYLTAPGGHAPTLRETARWLLAQGCSDALNLDGGPSTAAAWRRDARVVRLGAGRELPYAIRVR